MNYLAHAYLSNNIIPLQVGNLFGDFIKGRQIESLPKEIQTGIVLHREIDVFTDKHPLIIEAVEIFKPHFRLSGGIFVDILFDHFLANDELHFTDESLRTFTESIYSNLQAHKIHMSPKMESYFGYMTTYDWLYNYKFNEGLYKSIKGLCIRYPKLGYNEAVIAHIELHKKQLELIYNDFFPELKSYAEDYISSIDF